LEGKNKLKKDELIKITKKALADWRVRRNRQRLRAQNIKVQRVDISNELILLLCQNSNFEKLEFISKGINIEKETVFQLTKEAVQKFKKNEFSKNPTCKITKPIQSLSPQKHISANTTGAKSVQALPKSQSLSEGSKKTQAKKHKSDSPTKKAKIRYNSSPHQSVAVGSTNEEITSWFYKERQHSKMHFLLLEKFEETGGVPQAEDLIELEAEGILTMKQIVAWFNTRRQKLKLNLESKVTIRNSRVYPSLLNKFEEGKGWISKKDKHELAAESGLTISQITTWMSQKRHTLGFAKKWVCKKVD